MCLIILQPAQSAQYPPHRYYNLLISKDGQADGQGTDVCTEQL